ncbi:TolC family protein [Clostridium uliginosum]|uniref:Outer membrane efflux protein n=1 Tax=Clostridium uliginosum TaxID=119641 RepID=A0A1I1IYJ3_9CLOT|nr:TolC family protein [Clostridium uliginosum]SFC41316.1 Outer membrane efflux protein [Clostridium uliginosum]
MRKNINKLVAFAIGVSVMSGSIMPVFADENGQSTSTKVSIQTVIDAKSNSAENGVFTLNDAIKEAINNSAVLSLYDKKISYQSKFDDLNEELDDQPSATNPKGKSDNEKDLNQDTRDINLKQLKQQRNFEEDKLIQKTTKAYNDIVINQKKIAKAQKELEIKTRDLNNTKLKNQLEMVTTIDLQTTQLNIENLQNQKKSQENALKDAQDSFKVLTGKDVTKYALEQDIKYDTFKIDGSVDEYLDNVIENYLKYNEQLIKLNKDYYNDKDNKVDNPKEDNVPIPQKPDFNSYNGDYNKMLDDYSEYTQKLNIYNSQKQIYAGQLSARLSYLKAKLGTYEGETNLNETKKKFKESLKTLYTNLLTTEDNINWLTKNIELTNKQLSNAKLKYDLGMLTKSDYDTQVLNSENLDIQLRSTIESYNTLKEQIQKPWITFS